MQEETDRLRCKIEERKNQHMAELLEKDERIIRLTRELREEHHHRSKSPMSIDIMSSQGSLALGGGRSPIANFGFGSGSPERSMSQTEVTLLRTCQSMIDASSRIECGFCQKLFDTCVFYEHVVQERSKHERKESIKYQKKLFKEDVSPKASNHHQSSRSFNCLLKDLDEGDTSSTNPLNTERTEKVQTKRSRN